MAELTAEQIAQLGSWAGQRDAILSEINALRTERDKLDKENQEIANSSSSITNNLNQTIGRLDELTKKENDLVYTVSKNVSELQIKKTELEKQNEALEARINFFSEKEKELKDRLLFLSDTIGKLEGKSDEVTKIVSEIDKAGTSLTKKMNEAFASADIFVSSIATETEEHIGKINEAASNLNKTFVELNRKSLVKETINNKKT
jgi:uncharacterized coiled-coil DUF342 family protein